MNPQPSDEAPARNRLDVGAVLGAALLAAALAVGLASFLLLDEEPYTRVAVPLVVACFGLLEAAEERQLSC